jgi:hypothetical protein
MLSISAPFLIDNNDLLYQKYPKNALFSKKIHLEIGDNGDAWVVEL